MSKTLTDYWNFYVGHSEISNQPEALQIIECAERAIAKAFETGKKKGYEEGLRRAKVFCFEQIRNIETATKRRLTSGDGDAL